MKPFQSMPWHALIWRQWQQQIQDQQLPHALLLTGLAGLGKRTLARALAYFVLCTNHQGQQSCGHCRSCHFIEAGFHPDLLILEPEAEGKAIRVDQVREMTTQMQKSAQQGGYKVVLIWPAEALNINAANALLKTLEEPEPLTQFILVSDQPSSLPATLRSRCQIWPIAPPSLEQGEAWLKHQLSEEQQPQVLLKAAGGRPLAALKLATPEAEERRHLLGQVMEGLVRGVNPIEQAAKLKNLPLPALLNSLQSWLADSLRFGLLGETSVQDTRQLPLYRQLYQLLGPRSLLNLEQELQAMHHQLHTNPNVDLFLESLLIRLTQELHHE